ncbi:MAG: nucleotide sugar dehydrogenase [Ilumatobacteraceae bacterium]
MDATTFDERVAQRKHTVAVVGLGYVGLPLAVAFAEAGYPTVGFDVSAPAVNGLNAGVSHIDDVPDARVAPLVNSGTFKASTDASVLGSSSIVFICVPTPFDKAKTPDLSFVQSATESVAAHLTKGTLVILQSTTYPGTTTEFVKPILERGGMKAGVDFHLAFSPERVDPGNTQWGIGNTPKVVGGLTDECTRRSVALLATLMTSSDLVHPVKSPAIAEMCKLLENTYRAVNIAFVNELAQICHEMQIDVWEVIQAASTKPFGFQAFYPGIGPGGHCIPVDPHYLAWKAREFEFNTRFIELAADINSQMANYVVWRIQDMLNRSGKSLSGSTILCLGAAFKAGVSDVRNSRAIHVMELLQKQGASISYCDPHVPRVQVGSASLTSLDVTTLGTSNFDAVAVLVGSPSWPMADLEKTGKPIFDAVNAGGAPNGHRERL